MLKQLTPLQQRLVVSSAGVLLALVAIYLSSVPAFKPIFTAIIALTTALALREFYRIARIKSLEPADNLGILLSTCYIIAVALSTQYETALMLPHIVLLASLLSCFLYYFVYQKSPFINLSTMIFSIAYLAVPLGCIIFVAYFFPSQGPEDSRWWLFYLLAVTKMTDTGAFFLEKNLAVRNLPLRSAQKRLGKGLWVDSYQLLQQAF